MSLGVHVLMSMCAVYLPVHLCQFMSVYLLVCVFFPALVACVQYHPYCTAEPLSVSVFVLSSLVNPSSCCHGIPFNNTKHWSHCLNLGSHKAQFPMEEWSVQEGWVGYVGVQMFLSHALLSEAVGCVGNVV